MQPVNTLYLRLEGPMQAWGGHEAKFLIRRSLNAPTKSGVIGLLLAALGVSRETAHEDWLPKLTALHMGVRVDRPGVRWWDFHTVGAKMMLRTAENGKKGGAMLTRREYLCDAGFLVALMGEEGLLRELESALRNPTWTLYLGRKNCPPSVPIIDREPLACYDDLRSALAGKPWIPRHENERAPKALDCLIDWFPTAEQPEAPDRAEVWYDVPVRLDMPVHNARFVVKDTLRVGEDGLILHAKSLVSDTKKPETPRANYTNTRYREARKLRLEHDHGLCVFCKAPGTTVQHITYRRAGGDEAQQDLRALCRLCHDAITMIEYGEGMGIDRIDPCDEKWRERVLAKRSEIIARRSMETRRRKLEPEEV